MSAMRKTSFLVDGITALEIAFALLVDTLGQREPELRRQFTRSLESVLRNERLSNGTRRNLETLLSAFERNSLKKRSRQ
jgi:hypothetical protein